MKNIEILEIIRFDNPASFIMGVKANNPILNALYDLSLELLEKYGK